MNFFKKFINRRNDREANEYRLVKQRDAGEIAYFFEDTKSDGFITVEVNDDGSKGYELVRNLDDQENLKRNQEEFKKKQQMDEIVDRTIINYFEENKMTREDKLERLSELRENGSYNKKIPENKKKSILNSNEKRRKEMEREFANLLDNYGL